MSAPRVMYTRSLKRNPPQQGPIPFLCPTIIPTQALAAQTTRRTPLFKNESKTTTNTTQGVCSERSSDAAPTSNRCARSHQSILRFTSPYVAHDHNSLKASPCDFLSKLTGHPLVYATISTTIHRHDPNPCWPLWGAKFNASFFQS